MIEGIAATVSALVVVLAIAVAFLIPDGSAIVRSSTLGRAKSAAESDADAG